MSVWAAALVALAWLGWSLALAAALVLRRRMRLVADAEHELRGAATAIGLAAGRVAAGEAPAGTAALLRLQADRMTGGLADMAAARGAAVPPSAAVDAGRLAQVVGNVVANAAEHGVGPAALRCGRDVQGVTLEILTRDRPREGDDAAARRPGRGRGLAIAARAARRLGGGVEVERAGGITRTVVALPTEAAAALGRTGRPDPAASPDGERERPPRAA